MPENRSPAILGRPVQGNTFFLVEGIPRSTNFPSRIPIEYRAIHALTLPLDLTISIDRAILNGSSNTPPRSDDLYRQITEKLYI